MVFQPQSSNGTQPSISWSFSLTTAHLQQQILIEFWIYKLMGNCYGQCSLRFMFRTKHCWTIITPTKGLAGCPPLKINLRHPLSHLLQRLLPEKLWNNLQYLLERVSLDEGVDQTL